MKSLAIALSKLALRAWLPALTLALLSPSACSSTEPPAPAPSTCGSDADCAGAHCDPKNGCVSCLFDSHCAEGQRCGAGECYAPTACTADEDCDPPSFPVCDPQARECVRCLTDEQCGDSAHCRAGNCEAFEKCATEADCRAGTHCDLGSGECVSCLTRGDCPADNECVGGECKPSCRVEADCSSSGSHCTSAGYCAECATDEHCPDVYHCSLGACVSDSCAQGTSTCSDDKLSVSTCSPNGDGVAKVSCPAGQSCAVTSGAPACQPWLCAPGSARCSSDGAAVEVCGADGLSVATTTTCDDGERCVAGRCSTLACEPNAAFCRDGASYTCSFDGTKSTLSETCSSTRHCDEGTGKCVDNVCVPGTRTCADRAIGTCREDGSGYDNEPCDAAETCVDGECRALECAPSTRFCDDGWIRLCDANGTSSSSIQYCSQSCVTNGDSAYCQSSSCSPGAAMCDGQIATFCNQEGTGPEPGGVSCPFVGGYCQAGLCTPYVCTPLAKLCDGQFMAQCASDGTSWQLTSSYACTSWYHNYSQCNPTTGMCSAVVCTANTKSCSGTKVVSCDSTGFVQTELEDCATTGQLCSQGSCRPKVCDAGSYFCKDGNPNYCSDGFSSTVSDFCQAGEYCQAGSYYCQPDVCVAGQPVCNGGALSTCAADGSGPVGPGTACSAQQVCQDGACKPVTCTPYQLFCLEGNVHSCNATGTASTLYQYCVAESYCDSTTVACKPDVCVSGKPYCDGEVYKTCKTDGSGSVDAGTACNATSKVCSLSGCATTAVEVLGASKSPGAFSSSGSSYLYGNLLQVKQRRNLSKVELSLGVTGGPANLRWLVYSSTDGVTYYQVSDTVTSVANTATAWVSSSALNVTLEAGVYYWIGIQFAPSSSFAITYSYTDAVSSSPLGFATPLGDASLSLAVGSAAPASFKPTKNARLAYMRLSTTLP